MFKEDFLALTITLDVFLLYISTSYGFILHPPTAEGSVG